MADALINCEDTYHTREVAAIAATLALFKSDYVQAAQQATFALSLIPSEHLFARCVATVSLGYAARVNGDLQKANDSLAEAVMYGQMRDSASIVVFACYQLGQLHIAQGHLRLAAQTYHRALQLMREGKGEYLPTTALICIELARITLEWNDFEQAESLLEQGLHISRRTDTVDVLLIGLLALVKLRLAQGQEKTVGEVLEQAEDLVSRTRHPLLPAEVVAARVAFWLAQGKIAAANAWIRQLESSEQQWEDGSYDDIRLVQVRLYLANHQVAEAHRLLDSMQADSTVAGAHARKLAIDMVRIKACFMQGDVPQALDLLAQLLVIAEPEGYIRLFLDEDIWLFALLRHLLAQGKQVRYIHLLLGASAKYPVEASLSAADGTREVKHENQMLLSKREYEILRLIAQGLSNQDIANQLVISIGTVKTHINAIFRKLDAENRTQAVTQARSLGLL